MKVRLLVFTGILVVLALLLVYQALISPSIEFLRPSLRGQWIVHPEVFIDKESTFILRFKMDHLPESLKVRITSMRKFEARINDFGFLRSQATNWKHGDVLDLAPHVVIGENILQVKVVNREGPPTLLVEGRKLVRTDRRWHVASSVDSAVFKEAAVIGHDEVFLKGKEIRIWGTRYKWVLWLGVGASKTGRPVHRVNSYT